MDAYIWKCRDGHESAHTETEIRSLVLEPRCGLTLPNGEVCMAKLERKLRRLSVGEEVDRFTLP